MIYIVVALKAEALALIEKLSLSKEESREFDLYGNKNIKLIISKVGKINSAISTTLLLSKFPPKSGDKIINIGIAGSINKADIGKLYWIEKIIDLCENKVFHLQTKASSAQISTSPTPITDQDKIKTPLVDMEASGFFQAAKRFMQKDNIIILKIISDNLSTKELSTKEIKDLFIKHIEKIKGEIF